MPKLAKQTKDKIPDTQHQKRKSKKTPQGKSQRFKAFRIKVKIPPSKNKRFPVLPAAALMIIITGTAFAILFLSLQKKDTGEEKLSPAPVYYFSEEEEIPSVTTVVGEREFENLTVAAETESESREEIYEYLHIKDVASDIKSYQSYLEGEKNFIDVTADRQQPSSEASAEGSLEKSIEIYRLAGPSKDPESFLTVTLEPGADSYTITAVREQQPWNTYFKDLWTQQKKKIEDFEKSSSPTTTLQQAEDTVRAQGQEKLGLPEAADSYEYIAAPGLSKIDGKNYYTVRTYSRQPDETLIYVATYLFDHNSGSVAFRYDEVTRETTPLN